MKRREVGKASSESSASHLAAMESNTFTNLPNIIAHVAVTKYDDGGTRTPGWITVKTMGSAWVIQVKDPDGACQMSCVGQSLDEALALADLLLGSEEAPWEPDPWLRSKGKGTGKKTS